MRYDNLEIYLKYLIKQNEDKIALFKKGIDEEPTEHGSIVLQIESVKCQGFIKACNWILAEYCNVNTCKNCQFLDSDKSYCNKHECNNFQARTEEDLCGLSAKSFKEIK